MLVNPYYIGTSFQINTLKNTHAFKSTKAHIVACLLGRFGSKGAVFQVRHGAYLTTFYMIQTDF